MSRSYRFEGEYVFRFPDGAAVNALGLEACIADFFVGLAESHGGAVRGGIRVVPVDDKGDPIKEAPLH